MKMMRSEMKNVKARLRPTFLLARPTITSFKTSIYCERSRRNNSNIRYEYGSRNFSYGTRQKREFNLAARAREKERARARERESLVRISMAIKPIEKPETLRLKIAGAHALLLQLDGTNYHITLPWRLSGPFSLSRIL